jgi:hypothetical protein
VYTRCSQQDGNYTRLHQGTIYPSHVALSGEIVQISCYEWIRLGGCVCWVVARQLNALSSNLNEKHTMKPPPIATTIGRNTTGVHFTANSQPCSQSCMVVLLVLFCVFTLWLFRLPSKEVTPRAKLGPCQQTIRPISSLSLSTISSYLHHHGIEAVLYGRATRPPRFAGVAQCPYQSSDTCQPAFAPNANELTKFAVYKR